MPNAFVRHDSIYEIHLYPGDVSVQYRTFLRWSQRSFILAMKSKPTSFGHRRSCHSGRRAEIRVLVVKA